LKWAERKLQLLLSDTTIDKKPLKYRNSKSEALFNEVTLA